MHYANLFVGESLLEKQGSEYFRDFIKYIKGMVQCTFVVQLVFCMSLTFQFLL